MLARICVATALVCCAGFFAAPAIFEKRVNGVFRPPPCIASERARALHRDLFVADMHSDTLLWGRDMNARAARGHVDVPRLVEGNVGLQFFTTVTKVPFGLNIDRNDDKSDMITPLAIAQLWPPRTWGSLKRRALYQAERLERAARESQGKLTLIRAAADLDAYLARRKREPAISAGLLGMEGSHALEGNVANLDAMYKAGFRMIAPTHFFDTQVSGSASGVEKGGLTALGREWVARMESRKMLIDLAHASPRTLQEVLAMATRPVVVSHGGVKGVCNNNRTLSDDELRGIARTGGVVGIAFFEFGSCGRDARAIARAIRYAAGVAGVEHVALGSDFDGAIAAPFDATGLPLLTDALLAEGFDEASIRLIMGENVLRVLRVALP